MMKLTGLWKKQGKNGEFLAGRLGENSIMIFPNSKKTEESHPDYIAYLAEPQNKGYQQQTTQSAPPQRPQQQQRQNHAPAARRDDPMDEPSF